MNTIRGFALWEKPFPMTVFSCRKIHAAPLWTLWEGPATTAENLTCNPISLHNYIINNTHRADRCKTIQPLTLRPGQYPHWLFSVQAVRIFSWYSYILPVSELGVYCWKLLFLGCILGKCSHQLVFTLLLHAIHHTATAIMPLVLTQLVHKWVEQ